MIFATYIWRGQISFSLKTVFTLINWLRLSWTVLYIILISRLDDHGLLLRNILNVLLPSMCSTIRSGPPALFNTAIGSPAPFSSPYFESVGRTTPEEAAHRQWWNTEKISQKLTTVIKPGEQNYKVFTLFSFHCVILVPILPDHNFWPIPCIHPFLYTHRLYHIKKGNRDKM